MEANDYTTIHYTIRFYSLWHCGSGTSAGADIDALVIKDKNGMPFVPGKTLKGLIREAAETMLQLQHKDEALSALSAVFGEEGGRMGCVHFSDAKMDRREYDAIVANEAQEHLYTKLTTTSINADGVAKDHSLHSVEAVVPVTLHAEMTCVPAKWAEAVSRSLGMIKVIGTKRNRGLGRCDRKEGGEA